MDETDSFAIPLKGDARLTDRIRGVDISCAKGLRWLGPFRQ